MLARLFGKVVEDKKPLATNFSSAFPGGDEEKKEPIRTIVYQSKPPLGEEVEHPYFFLKQELVDLHELSHKLSHDMTLQEALTRYYPFQVLDAMMMLENVQDFLPKWIDEASKLRPDLEKIWDEKKPTVVELAEAIHIEILVNEKLDPADHLKLLFSPVEKLRNGFTIQALLFQGYTPAIVICALKQCRLHDDNAFNNACIRSLGENFNPNDEIANIVRRCMFIFPHVLVNNNQEEKQEKNDEKITSLLMSKVPDSEILGHLERLGIYDLEAELRSYSLSFQDKGTEKKIWREVISYVAIEKAKLSITIIHSGYSPSRFSFPEFAINSEEKHFLLALDAFLSYSRSEWLTLEIVYQFMRNFFLETGKVPVFKHGIDDVDRKIQKTCRSLMNILNNKNARDQTLLDILSKFDKIPSNKSDICDFNEIIFFNNLLNQLAQEPDDQFFLCFFQTFIPLFRDLFSNLSLRNSSFSSDSSISNTLELLREKRILYYILSSIRREVNRYVSEKSWQEKDGFYWSYIGLLLSAIFSPHVDKILLSLQSNEWMNSVVLEDFSKISWDEQLVIDYISRLENIDNFKSNLDIFNWYLEGFDENFSKKVIDKCIDRIVNPLMESEGSLARLEVVFDTHILIKCIDQKADALKSSSAYDRIFAVQWFMRLSTKVFFQEQSSSKLRLSIKNAFAKRLLTFKKEPAESQEETDAFFEYLYEDVFFEKMPSWCQEFNDNGFVTREKVLRLLLKIMIIETRIEGSKSRPADLVVKEFRSSDLYRVINKLSRQDLSAMLCYFSETSLLEREEKYETARVQAFLRQIGGILNKVESPSSEPSINQDAFSAKQRLLLDTYPELRAFPLLQQAMLRAGYNILFLTTITDDGDLVSLVDNHAYILSVILFSIATGAPFHLYQDKLADAYLRKFIEQHRDEHIQNFLVDSTRAVLKKNDNNPDYFLQALLCGPEFNENVQLSYQLYQLRRYFIDLNVFSVDFVPREYKPNRGETRDVQLKNLHQWIKSKLGDNLFCRLAKKFSRDPAYQYSLIAIFANVDLYLNGNQAVSTKWNEVLIFLIDIPLGSSMFTGVSAVLSRYLACKPEEFVKNLYTEYTKYKTSHRLAVKFARHSLSPENGIDASVFLMALALLEHALSDQSAELNYCWSKIKARLLKIDVDSDFSAVYDSLLSYLTQNQQMLSVDNMSDYLLSDPGVAKSFVEICDRVLLRAENADIDFSVDDIKAMFPRFESCLGLAQQYVNHSSNAETPKNWRFILSYLGVIIPDSEPFKEVIQWLRLASLQRDYTPCYKFLKEQCLTRKELYNIAVYLSESRHAIFPLDKGVILHALFLLEEQLIMLSNSNSDAIFLNYLENWKKLKTALLSPFKIEEVEELQVRRMYEFFMQYGGSPEELTTPTVRNMKSAPNIHDVVAPLLKILVTDMPDRISEIERGSEFFCVSSELLLLHRVSKEPENKVLDYSKFNAK